jgi:hypothetical protein
VSTASSNGESDDLKTLAELASGLWTAENSEVIEEPGDRGIRKRG